MIVLKEKPTLRELQQYMHDVCEARGWNKVNDLELFLLFSEEVGELAKAIRDQRKLFAEKPKDKDPRQNLEEEFADVLSYLIDLANHFEVDLEKAFRDKEAVNNKRVWI